MTEPSGFYSMTARLELLLSTSPSDRSVPHKFVKLCTFQADTTTVSSLHIHRLFVVGVLVVSHYTILICMNETIQRRGKNYDEVIELNNREKVTEIIGLAMLLVCKKQWYAQRVHDIQAAGCNLQYERDLQSQP